LVGDGITADFTQFTCCFREDWGTAFSTVECMALGVGYCFVCGGGVSSVVVVVDFGSIVVEIIMVMMVVH